MVYGQYHLAKEWVRQGHRVTIVAASYSHIRQVQPHVESRVTEDYIDGIRYLWIRTPAYCPSSKLGRVWSIVSFTVQCWFAPLPVSQADLIICSSHHPFAILPSRKLAKKFCAKLVFEVRDLWPLTLIELGGANPKHPFIRLMQYSENHAYKVSDKVVSVLPAADRHMIQHGMIGKKFLFVPNGIEISIGDGREELPPSYKKQLEALKREGKLLIGYAGKVGLSNVLEPLIDAISECEDDAIHVVILGEGEFLHRLRAKVDKSNLTGKVTFLEPVSRAQVNEFLEYLDIAYVGYMRQRMYRFGVSPTKVNDYMLAKLPIIYAVDAPGNTVAESGAGITCPPEDSAAIRSAILELRDLGEDARKEIGFRGKKWLIENRNYVVLAKQFLDGVFAEE